MITIPVHDLLLLPGVMFYFKKDMFQMCIRDRSSSLQVEKGDQTNEYDD